MAYDTLVVSDPPTLFAVLTIFFPSCSPVWSETITSANQNTEATAALPRVAVPSCP